MDFAFRSGPLAGSIPGTCVLTGEVEFPQLVLRQAEFEHNLAAMRDFCIARDVSIAPHAKTTMAPAIIRQQLKAGAWGVTVATVSQLGVCLDEGVPVVLLANELVNPKAARWLGETLARRSGQQVYCIADSVTGVGRMAQGWRASGNPGQLPVLVELGVRGGRSGCRTHAEAEKVAAVIAEAPELSLAGIEAFEGIIPGGRTPAVLREVDDFLFSVADLATRLDRLGFFKATPEVILTAGGSEFFDRVAENLRAVTLTMPHRVILRSGCYAFHDHGQHPGVPLLVGADATVALRPALELWCEVISVPEPGLAIAALGKRDAPYDSRLPVVFARRPAGSTVTEPCTTVTVARLNDQHAYLSVAPGGELAVGDLLGCGIFHACTAFDKWRRLALVDDDYRVLELIDTYF